MAINDRISYLIGELHTNANVFAENIGVKSAVIYNIIKGRRSKPSFDVLQKILISYEMINANWLLRGEGDLWKNGEKDFAQDTGYASIEERIGFLVTDLRRELADNPSLEELSELIHTLLNENIKQRDKITALYAKQEKILEVLRNKLNLDL